MIRGTVALMDRSLRVDTRSLRAHLLRMLFVLVIIGSLAVAHQRARAMIVAAPGKNFLEAMMFITLILVSLGGMGLFATTITEEKEEQTLGLLQMAGVGPMSLLLGKGVTRLFIALLILAVQFPFLLLSVTLGGVLSHQVWAAYLSICAYLLWIANLGLFFSVICRSSRQASFLVTIVLVVYLIGEPFAEMLFQSLTSFQLNGELSPTEKMAEWMLDWWRETHVFHRMSIILGSSFNEPLFSWQVIIHTISGAALFVLSWLLFPVFNREDRGEPTDRPLFSLRPGKARRWAVPRPWPIALVWKDFFYMTGGWTMIVAKFILYPLVILTVALFFSAVSPFRTYNWLEYLGNSAIWISILMGAIEISIYCSRIFREEIRGRTLPTIAMLPESIVELVYAKWLGCFMALGPALCCFLFGLFLYPDDFWDFLGTALDEPGFYYFLLQFVIGWHLCTLLSMFLKFGAAPLSIAVVLIGNILLLMMTEAIFGFGSHDDLAVLGCCASVLVIIGLHAGVLFRVSLMAER